MRKIISVIVIYMCLIASSHASNIPDFPFILVTGESEIKEKPDTALMTIYLTSFNKESSIADREISETSEYIIKSAKELNIPIDSVTFKPISKSVTRSRSEQYQSLEILGYEMSREVNVNFSSLERFSEFSDKITSKNNIEKVDTKFGLSSESKINEILVKNACEDAKSKASLLAHGLGVSLGSVFAVTQDAKFSDITAAFEIMSRGDSSLDVGYRAEQSKLQIVPKTISFNKKVNVLYKISE